MNESYCLPKAHKFYLTFLECLTRNDPFWILTSSQHCKKRSKTNKKKTHLNYVLLFAWIVSDTAQFLLGSGNALNQLFAFFLQNDLIFCHTNSFLTQQLGQFGLRSVCVEFACSVSTMLGGFRCDMFGCHLVLPNFLLCMIECVVVPMTPHYKQYRQWMDNFLFTMYSYTSTRRIFLL